MYQDEKKESSTRDVEEAKERRSQIKLAARLLSSGECRNSASARKTSVIAARARAQHQKIIATKLSSCDNSPRTVPATMLTEHFVAAIAAQTKANTGITKDAGIFFHEYQPLAAQRHVFKKSAAASNGLAVSGSHIFAAQEGKAVVHVYSREKGNQEAIVPFPERIHSIALAAKDTVLLLGTESGRVLAWEVSPMRTPEMHVGSHTLLDLLWPARLDVYIAPPTRHLHRRRPCLQLLPLGLSGCHDPCMGVAFDSILFTGYLALAGAYSLHAPWSNILYNLRPQL
jgi:hypothetical protein